MSFRVEKFKVTLRDALMPGFLLRWRAALNGVPDSNLYNPTFQPWRGSQFRRIYDEIRGNTLVTPEAAWVLYSLARQALVVDGDFLEAGVYRGGTARLLRQVLKDTDRARRLHLLDTFGGMPTTESSKDLHKAGDFADTSVEAVSAFVGRENWIIYTKGLIPESFRSLEKARFAFAHVDVDIHESVRNCCEFLYPRMAPGGIIVFDDYGHPSCPGARLAVDEFFATRPEVPLVLHSGQAVAFRTTQASPEMR